MKESKSFITIGPIQALTIVFLVLKLTHVIAWSWLWVLSPLWIPIAALLLFLTILGALALIVK